MKKLPEYLEGAYKIFVDEYQQHLSYFSSLNLDESSYNAKQEEVSRRFHTVKGGAGFLLLDKIAKLTSEGEEIFKGAYEEETLTRFKEIVKLLQLETENL